MHRSFSSRILELTLLAVLLAAWTGTTAAAPLSLRYYCSAGKPLRTLTLSYSRSIPASQPGTPLDAALRSEQLYVERARDEARSAFITQPPGRLGALMDDYTFLIPDSMKESFSVGSIVGLSEISAAIRYRTMIWREVIERFTTVREAYSEDPYVMRFEISLDLSFFCRYGKPIQSLVTQ